VPLRESVIETVEQVTTDPDQPLHQRAYRSPLRDERLAAWLGAPLGILFVICFATGLFSHIQQHPLKWLPVPARPAGLYRVTQGIHVICGIAAVPLLFAKLWVVWPRFVALPPFRRVSDVVERLGILALVGGGVFMVFSGVADIAQWYPWRFSFTASHYWVAWITIGAILAHLGAKWHIVRRSLRRGADVRSADPELGTTAEVPHPGLTRRGFLATVAGASGALVLVTAGQTVPVLRRLALLAPRNPASQPINKSAANAGVLVSARSSAYRLTVGGRVSRPLSLTLDELMALPGHQADLPIACVEGWSYSARWGGVRLSDLMAMAGAPPDAAANVVSLERNSPYTVSFVNHFQAHDHDTLLATHLDGSPLSLDHGYPLRLIGPDRPGVNQTKWVTQIVVV
jgi:DMSO/TMAO reductase YedYZ molybdopterin-dependent catalytic subunit